MADLLTSPQKTKLRADSHKVKFFLAIVEPATLLTAQVNGTLARGAIAITFDGGTSPGVSLIRAGMTVTVVGADGVSFQTRIAAFNSSGSTPNISGTITVDPNSYLWPDNASLIIEDMHDPRVIPPEFDATTGISKKRSATFTNQTRKPGPIARMQGHKVKMTSDGAATFDLAGSGVPVMPGATISSRLWACSDGTIGSASSANTTISFTGPGGRWVYHTVTDSNGKSDIAVRHYWTFVDDPEDPDYPYVDFEVSQIPNSFDGGGQISVIVSGVSDFTKFRDGTLIVIFCRTWYGGVEGEISLITGSENILFSGYIVKDTISTDAEHGTVSFDAQNPAGIMKSLPMQALSIHAEASIIYWFQTDRRMTLIMILQWLLYWHSNVLSVFEWNIATIGLYKKLFQFNEGTLGSMVQDIASKFLCQLGCDKAGNVYVERNINTLEAAARAAVEIVSDITPADWQAKQVIARRHRKQVSAVRASGFYYDGGSQLIPYCAIAPTKIRETSGSNPSGVDGLVVNGQTMINQLAGRFLAMENNPLEELRLSMAGNYSVMDVFPQRWWRMTLDADDTPRGILLTDYLFVPRSVTQVMDIRNGYLGIEAVFQAEAFGPIGTFDPCPTTGTVTQTPEEKTPSGGSTSSPTESEALVTMSSLRYLADDQADEWTLYDDQFTVNDGRLDPYWKIKQGSQDPIKAIYWLVGLNGAVRRRTAQTLIDRDIITDPPNSWSDGTAPTVLGGLDLTRIYSSIFSSGLHYVAANFVNGSSQYRSWIVRTQDDFQTVAYTTLFEASDVQTRLLSLAEDQQDGTILWLTCWRNGTLWLEKWSTATMTRTSNYNLGSATAGEMAIKTYWAEVAEIPEDKNELYVFGRMNAPAGLTGVRHIIRTRDGGTTWESIESGWDTDHCAALALSLKSGGLRNRVALRRPEL